MAERTSRVTGLTVRGRCLLAAGVAAGICALVLNERDLLQVAAFLFALPLLAMLAAALSKARVDARRTVTPARVAVGGTAEARIRLGGARRFPTTGLLLEDTVPDTVSPNGNPRFLVPAFTTRGGPVLAYRVQPVLRGVHPLGPLRTRVSDPFGLAQYDKELGCRDRLVVVPETVPLSGLPNGSLSATGAGGDAGSRQWARPHAGQDFDDATVRQYRYGDDLRRVHWRTTAHRDELMVRTEERPSGGDTTLLLDHRRSAHGGTGGAASLEWAISFVASAHLHLRRAGRQARVVTDDGSVLAGTAQAGAPAPLEDDSLLGTLAGLHASHRRDLCYHSSPPPGGELIAVLGALGPVTASRFAASLPSGARGRAILLDVPRWSASGDTGDTARETGEAAAALAAAGWSVVTAHRGDSVAAVWRTLCEQLPGATTTRQHRGPSEPAGTVGAG